MRDCPEIENTLITGYPYDISSSTTCCSCGDYIYDGEKCYKYEGDLYCIYCGEDILKNFIIIFDEEDYVNNFHS